MGETADLEKGFIDQHWLTLLSSQDSVFSADRSRFEKIEQADLKLACVKILRFSNRF